MTTQAPSNKPKIRPGQDVSIKRDGHGIVRYSPIQAIIPCRADKVVRDAYWVTDPTRGGALIFLDAPTGHVPQYATDDVAIALMKRILFPWCEIRQFSAVYLVRDRVRGWKIPYGQIQ